MELRNVLNMYQNSNVHRSIASKWDLVKILGTEAQFRQWIDNFLIKDKFVEEMCESRQYERIYSVFLTEIQKRRLKSKAKKYYRDGIFYV